MRKMDCIYFRKITEIIFIIINVLSRILVASYLIKFTVLFLSSMYLTFSTNQPNTTHTNFLLYT